MVSPGGNGHPESNQFSELDLRTGCHHTLIDKTRMWCPLETDEQRQGDQEL